MSTKQRLLEYVSSLQAGDKFTTRDVLYLAPTRGPIDNALGKLVRENRLERLAYGVFRKPGPGLPDVPIEEIARIKARAFGKTVVVHDRTHAAEFGLVQDDQLTRYSVDGSSSSFRSQGGRVYLMRTSARKLKLGDSKVARGLRALWHVGKKALSDEAISIVVEAVGEKLHSALRSLVALIPEWLRLRITRHLDSSPGGKA